MLAYIYPFSFVFSLLSLIGWFYFTELKPKMSRKMSYGFIGFFFLYLFALSFADATFKFKLLILFRDLVILGVVSQVFHLLKRNVILFIAGLVAVFAGIKFFYFKKLTQTFPQYSINYDHGGELLVEVKDGGQIIDLHTIIDKYGIAYEELVSSLESPELTDLDDYYVLNIPDNQERNIEKIIEELNESGLIDWVEYNEEIILDDMEGEARKDKKTYGINDPGVENLWGFDAMNVDKLYNLFTSSKLKPQKKALIAILDTGIDAQHEDIKDHYTSTKTKYDNDPRQHGTHCAGIAASVSNNGKGVASFTLGNDYVQVTSIKVLNANGMGTQASILKGMAEAADAGADVISMSLGGRSSDSKQRAYRKAVEYANKKGAIVVAAAGNNGGNAKAISPANTKGIITVSAIDIKLEKAVFSNTINDLEMGIAAPGVDIYSTIPGNSYASFNGTSMATPYVAGLVGLMKSLNPDLTTKEAYNILKTTGVDTKDTELTGKLIQPAEAVKKVIK